MSKVFQTEKISYASAPTKFSVSVVIPAYNAEKVIIRALDSIKNQTWIRCIKEIIVVNDGSKDRTKDEVEKYQRDNPNLPVKLVNKDNGGVSTARNAGLHVSSGDWIALLDADDEWLPNKIELQLKTIQAHPEIDFIGGNHTSEPVMVFWKKINRLYAPNINELCIKMFPQTSTAMFRRKIFTEIGGYDETRRYCEDGQFFMKICGSYGYYYMPDQVAVYDGGRRGFGVRGLSGDIKQMHHNYMINIKELYQQKRIVFPIYVFVWLYSELKYLRRIAICSLDNLNKKEDTLD